MSLRWGIPIALVVGLAGCPTLLSDFSIGEADAGDGPGADAAVEEATVDGGADARPVGDLPEAKDATGRDVNADQQNGASEGGGLGLPCDPTDPNSCAGQCDGAAPCGCINLCACTGQPLCAPMGDGGQGAPCATSPENQNCTSNLCAPGLACVGQQCAHWCNTKTGAGCPAGTACDTTSGYQCYGGLFAFCFPVGAE